MKYRFVFDGDSHWYLINANMVEHFNDWLNFQEVEEHSSDKWEGFDFNTKMIGCCPSQYTFENPEKE